MSPLRKIQSEARDVLADMWGMAGAGSETTFRGFQDRIHVTASNSFCIFINNGPMGNNADRYQVTTMLSVIAKLDNNEAGAIRAYGMRDAVIALVGQASGFKPANSTVDYWFLRDIGDVTIADDGTETESDEFYFLTMQIEAKYRLTRSTPIDLNDSNLLTLNDSDILVA